MCTWQTIFMMEQFLLSGIPFYCGVYAAVSWRLIPFCVRNLEYCPLWFELGNWIELPLSVSTHLFVWLQWWEIYLHLLWVAIHKQLKIHILIKLVGMVPHRLVCITSNSPFALWVLNSKGTWCCFLVKQPEHSCSVVGERLGLTLFYT